MFIIQRMSPIQPMLRVHVKEKLVSISPSQLAGLASKLCHLGRHMRWWVFGPNPSMKPLGHICWIRVILLDQFLRILACPQSYLSEKWAKYVRSAWGLGWPDAIRASLYRVPSPTHVKKSQLGRKFVMLREYTRSSFNQAHLWNWMNI